MPDIITMPDSIYRFSSMQFNIVTLNTQSGASSFNPLSRVVGPSAYFWRVSLSIAPQDYDEVDELEQFVTRLKGGLVLARIYHILRVAPKGAGGVTTTVNAAADAAAGATSVMIKNLLPSEAIALKSMDHIGIGENLHRIVNSGGSDAGGQGTFEVWPPLRAGIAVDDPINLSKVTGLFMLTEGQDSLQIAPPTLSQGMNLTFLEAPNFDA